MAQLNPQQFGVPWSARKVPSDLFNEPLEQPSHFVCGLPSCLRKPASRRVVGRVLQQIKEHFPRDFARLKARIVMIRPISEAEFDKGTRGEWKGRDGNAAYREIDPVTIPHEVLDRMNEWVCGILELPEVGRVTEEALAANAAHELGHDCTLCADIERRQAPDDDEEWGSEAAADWYAYKWGFGKLISATRKGRLLGHHGPGPGQIVYIGYQRSPHKLSRNFVYHRVK